MELQKGLFSGDFCMYVSKESLKRNLRVADDRAPQAGDVALEHQGDDVLEVEQDDLAGALPRKKTKQGQNRKIEKGQN